MAVPYKLHL